MAKQLTQTRMLLLGGVVLLAAVVGLLVLLSGDEESTADLTTAPTPLFGVAREPHCGNPMECDAKAHESYDRARKLSAAAGADPGNLYRAALDMGRARSYREQSGKVLPDIADVESREESARKQAESAFDDGRIALKRAIAAGKIDKIRSAVTLLTYIVPDEHHPYRIKLDAYRRSLPRSRP